MVEIIILFLIFNNLEKDVLLNIRVILKNLYGLLNF